MLRAEIKSALLTATVATALASAAPAQTPSMPSDATVEAARWLAERHRQEGRAADEGRKFCQGRPSVEIGMTGREVLASKWGLPYTTNTTETITGTRVQWVYNIGPACKEDGSATSRYGTPGYLYFEDGLLVAIQR